ncbi:GNAT family N-acetyltransferase [Pannonibacter phragmitetus]|uniref:GNAT family N-acetyltransferase n=1 Tax=Pannonibacter phragmitetus TaxID=121719 RepID=UPI000F03D850|nr:GNAT family N-acetyltransferase [Pannonibacter phragmitetus]
MPVIRRPRPEEAEAVAECLRRSIVELCHADHGGDPDKYTPWIANKTAENMVRWMDQAEGFLIAEDGAGGVAAVALASGAGEIHLNYVHPEHRFKGYSRALMLELETWVRDLGHTRIRLNSTQTAKTFYLALGYREDGESFEQGGMHFLRLAKDLT